MGSLHISVADASKLNNFGEFINDTLFGTHSIENAIVRISNADGSFITQETVKDSYSITLPVGSYDVEVSAEGYNSFKTSVNVNACPNIYLDVKLIPNNLSYDTGILHISVADALKLHDPQSITDTLLGKPMVENAIVKITNDAGNVTTHEIINDECLITLPFGYYSVEITADGYEPFKTNVVIARHETYLDVRLYPTNTDDSASVSEASPSVVTAGDSTYVIKADGSLWAWGLNDYGQLGDGTTQDRHSPVHIMDNVDGIAADNASAFAVKNDSSLWAWGCNEHGHLGDGTTTNKYKPVLITDGVLSISAHELYADGCRSVATFIHKNDNSLWGWGNAMLGWDSDYNQILIGNDGKDIIPSKMMDGVKSIFVQSFGAYSELFLSIFVIKEDDSLWRWGYVYDGYSVDESENCFVFSPAFVMSDVQSITVPDDCDSVYIIRNNGSLWAYGSNCYGQLGDGTTQDRFAPVRVMDNVDQIIANQGTVCAIKTDGSLWTWGNNYLGAVGDGSTKNRSNPYKVLENVGMAALYRSSVYAIASDGVLYSWGYNDCGQLGDATTQNRYVPTPICQDARYIVADWGIAYLIKADGSLWGWGYNQDGRLGDGTMQDRHIPVKIMAGVRLPNNSIGQNQNNGSNINDNAGVINGDYNQFWMNFIDNKGWRNRDDLMGKIAWETSVGAIDSWYKPDGHTIYYEITDLNADNIPELIVCEHHWDINYDLSVWRYDSSTESAQLVRWKDRNATTGTVNYCDNQWVSDAHLSKGSSAIICTYGRAFGGEQEFYYYQMVNGELEIQKVLGTWPQDDYLSLNTMTIFEN